MDKVLSADRTTVVISMVIDKLRLRCIRTLDSSRTQAPVETRRKTRTHYDVIPFSLGNYCVLNTNVKQTRDERLGELIDAV